MSYEEYTIFAIQRTDQPSFVERFRMFSTKEERDSTLEFMLANSPDHIVKAIHAAEMKITVRAETNNQLMFGLEDPIAEKTHAIMREKR